MQGNSELKAQPRCLMNKSSIRILQMLHMVLKIQVVFAIQLSIIYELLNIWAVNHGYQDGIPAKHGLRIRSQNLYSPIPIPIPIPNRKSFKCTKP